MVKVRLALAICKGYSNVRASIMLGVVLTLEGFSDGVDGLGLGNGS